MIHFIGDGGHAKVCRPLVGWYVNVSEKYTFIAIGSNADRKREAQMAKRPFAVLMHPSAIIANTARYGQGCVFMAGVILQDNARIGEHVILNTGCTVDHDCVIEDYAHIAPGAHLCGNVHVCEGALVGVGVGIEPGVVIPAWSLVKRERYTICPMK